MDLRKTCRCYRDVYPNVLISVIAYMLFIIGELLKLYKKVVL